MLIGWLIIVLASVTRVQSQTEGFICSKLLSFCASLLVCSLAKMSTPLWGFLSHECVTESRCSVRVCCLTNKTKPGNRLRIVDKSFHRNYTCLSSKDATFASHSVFERAEGRFNCSPKAGIWQRESRLF